MKPAIELERYEIEELSYVRSVDNEDLGSDNLKLAIESGMTEDRKNGKVTLKAKFVYLRSAISMVSSLDSSDAVLIPTVNILSLLEEQAKDK